MPIPSAMVPLGSKASPFSLFDTVSEKILSLQDLKSNHATVVMFICNHCPYVKHILPKLIDTIKIFQQKNISFIAINANDAEKFPEDAPDNMHKEALQHGFTFPYLFDETQQIAKAYGAVCTPDFFVFDKELVCVYRGRFDDSTPGNGLPVTGSELSAALNAILANKAVNSLQQPSLGCSIKWKKEFSSV